MLHSQHNNLHDLRSFDFPVKMIDVHHYCGGDLFKVGDYKAVHRTDTNSILAIHSDKYRLTTHVEVFKSTIEVLEDVLWNTGSWPDSSTPIVDRQAFTIKDHVFNDGKLAMREIICHAISIIGPDGHRLSFRIRQINSYDASSRYIMQAGIWREWCSNGAGSFTSKISSTSQKHTSRINIAAEKGKLKHAIEAFYADQTIWKAWHQAQVATNNVIRCFALTVVAEKGKDPHTGQQRYNKKQLGILTDAWERNSLQLGRTKWAAYQAATWWASHGEGVTRTAAEISLEREPKVQAMIDSEYWRNL